MNDQLFPVDMSTQERIAHLQDIQHRSQQLMDALEQRRHLSLEELNRLDREYGLWRARQRLLWHLQGDVTLDRLFADWPGFLIDAHQRTAA